MVKRRISKEKYVLAACITLFIFTFGVILGFYLDEWRLGSIELANKEQEVNYASLQFQYLFLTALEDENAACPVIHTALDEAVQQLSRSLDEYQSYKKDTTINEKEYRIVGRKYLIDNLRYWFLAKKSKQTCDINLVNVLYFYSDKYCSNCPDQGTILTYFKKLYGEKLLVFPIDVDLEDEESLITIIKTRYNITSYPSLVIFDQKYEGLFSKEILGQLICDSFNDKSSCLT